LAKYAFLDLDGTLVRTNLAHLAVHHASRRTTLSGRFGSLALLAASSPALATLDMVSRSAFQELLFRGFRGLSVDRLRYLGEHAAEHVLIQNLRPGVRELLARLRAAGLEPVLTTGSLEHVVTPFARALDIAHYAANRLEVHQGQTTGRLVPPVMSGARKAAWIRSFCHDRDAQLGDCHAYSDSGADLPMLAIVGHPCAVHPDRELLLEARAMQWPIVALQVPSPPDELIAGGTS
jgi:HAD superfamily hydrolase (TIGR01490 family)